MKKIINICLFTFLFLSVISCRTRIDYLRYKPSPVNMVDSRNIAIFNIAGDSYQQSYESWTEKFLKSLFFSQSYEDPLIQRVGQYATDRMTNVLYATNYFTIIPANTVTQAARSINNQILSNSDLGTILGVDAIIEGVIHRLNYSDQRYTVENIKTLEDGSKVVEEVEKLKRTFYIHMTCNVIKTGNKQILAGAYINTSESVTVNIGKSDVYPSSFYYLDGYDIYTKKIDGLVRTLRYQIAPTPISEVRYLLVDKTKNSKMKLAQDLAKNRLYEQAYNVYEEIWNSSKMYEAGFNAALLLESQMKLQAAKAMFEEVLAIYPGKDVMRALLQVEEIIRQQKKVEEQFN